VVQRICNYYFANVAYKTGSIADNFTVCDRVVVWLVAISNCWGVHFLLLRRQNVRDVAFCLVHDCVVDDCMFLSVLFVGRQTLRVHKTKLSG